MEAASRPRQTPATGKTYARRQPETTALYRTLQEHLTTFEQEWTEAEGGRSLPRFVLEELRGFMSCGILARGFAHLYCDTCRERHLVAFCCKGRGFCPSCLGRRMNAGAADLVDRVLPDVPIRQWVLVMPFPLRFPLAFDGKLLGAVLRIFTDTVAAWYRARQADRGLAGGECGALTVIQRGSSDLRLNPHFHTVFLDGVYAPSRDGGAPAFHPAPGPTQEEVEAVVHRAGKRILRYLEKRGVITLVAAPGEGEVNVLCDDTLGEQDPLLARLLAAATTGAAPAGPAKKRAPVRIAHDAGGPVPKGKLCAQDCGFNLHAATRVAANDRTGRATLCRYILRPPLANDRLQLLPDGTVRLALKRARSDGTNSVLLQPLTLIARLAALVPPARRHITRYFGVLSSHSKLRSQVVPAQPAPAEPASKAPAQTESPRPGRYIPWAELLRRTYDIDVLECQRCQGRLRLIAMVKTEATIRKILGAMGLPTEAPNLHPARPPPSSTGSAGDAETAGDQDRLN